MEERSKSENKKINFALIGVAGYIAPRHLNAIKENGGEVIATLDPHDSVGILDKYFPNSKFFTSLERFDRYLDKLNRDKSDSSVDYVSICSPNYLHDAHVRIALRNNAHAICEKPLVLNPWNIDPLIELAKKVHKKIFTVLQLMLHPDLHRLKSSVDNNKSKKKYEVILTYITPRGNWYLNSWKGDTEQSGGLATNIGIHFFDLLIWIFGKVKNNELHYKSKNKLFGYLELENANVKWFLSIDANDLEQFSSNNTYRSLTVDGDEIEFSNNFTDLHYKIYRDILDGGGFDPDDSRDSIMLAHQIRESKIIVTSKNTHPLGSNVK